LTLAPSSSGKEERKYEFLVNRLVGRLKFFIHIENKVVNFKFDGWPEICLSIATTSKFDTRLDPKISEIITSKLSAAIRNATVELDLEELENFPALPALQAPRKSERVRFLLMIVDLYKVKKNNYGLLFFRGLRSFIFN